MRSLSRPALSPPIPQHGAKSIRICETELSKKGNEKSICDSVITLCVIHFTQGFWSGVRRKGFKGRKLKPIKKERMSLDQK